MQARIANPAMILDAGGAVQELYKSVYKGGVSQTILELVHLRASQINGCAPCVLSGLSSLRKAGESEERIGLVSAWREAPFFTEEEKAALALTEAATRIADGADGVSDAVWDGAAQFFDEKQLAAIVMMIAVTNLFNRLNGPTRQVAGQAW
ncbi:carboxymuconolactone decarboxylase family protein [Catenulispora yoronensis]|uniref:Carboxymuconolactone decarboxylase family protein n=1 Tax=Catenulispora yoronensis TaxID=450799 RepID=A0ABN2TPR1_9ACTN